MGTKNKKVLYLDIESSRLWVTMPVYDLKFTAGYISPKYVTKDWYITAAAWGWLDVQNKKIKNIKAVSGLDFPLAYAKDHRNDQGVVKALLDIIGQADLIVGHNLDSFDLAKINYRAAFHKLPIVDLPPTVDTLKAARRYMKATSNSLYYLTKEFGLETKIQLPPGVMHEADEGCAKSLKKLIAYNKGDIKAGADLYFEILPRIKNHPNLNIFNTEKRLSGKKTDIICGNCGSSDIIKAGIRPTLTGIKQKYSCKCCGSITLATITKPIKAA